MFLMHLTLIFIVLRYRYWSMIKVCVCVPRSVR